MTNEFFPPDEAELEQMILVLKKKLEDDKYQEDWVAIHDEMKILEKQLKQLTIQNEAL